MLGVSYSLLYMWDALRLDSAAVRVSTRYSIIRIEDSLCRLLPDEFS